MGLSFKEYYGDLSKVEVYEGNIDVSNAGLTSLEGAPKRVNARFSCANNKLRSLKYSQEYVKTFVCRDNKIKSLKLGPKEAEVYFCGYNPLNSLKGVPEELDTLHCEKCGLKTLEGSPRIINGTFNFSYNNLETLEGCPEFVGGVFNCTSNRLENLKGMSKELIMSIDTFMGKKNYNPHLELEFEVRKENPDLSDDEIFILMYEKTGYDGYITKEIKEIFLF